MDAKFANQVAAQIRIINSKLASLETKDDDFSLETALKRVEGRRIMHTMVGNQSFTITQNGTKGNPITFTVSQDGPFILTHYPMVAWKVNAPSTADNFGRWMPITTWSTPAQDLANMDSIDLSYEMADDGSQRNLQNENAVSGLLLSRPGCLLPLPKETYFRPNSVISFTPTYEDIFFDTAPTTDSTGGLLVVCLPGYKIVNLG